MSLLRVALMAGQAFHDTLLDEVELHIAHTLERKAFKGSVAMGIESLTSGAQQSDNK